LWIRTGLDGLGASAESPERLDLSSRAKLRAALNQVSEEIEYLQDRVRANDAAFWLEYNLPVWKWAEHGALIAEHETAVHARARKMYAEVDRLQHCIDGMRKNADPEEPPEVLSAVLDIEHCGTAKFLQRASAARLQIRRTLERL